MVVILLYFIILLIFCVSYRLYIHILRHINTYLFFMFYDIDKNEYNNLITY
ncbi:hypothetical protein [Fowlpox virus]|nr:hypothetical protein [Fowlpox virus]UQT20582.1 hypothetical protein [Fowlpox virus]